MSAQKDFLLGKLKRWKPKRLEGKKKKSNQTIYAL